MRTACYMRTTNLAKTRLTASSAKSTRSTYHSSKPDGFVLTCPVPSVDKKSKFSRKRANEDEGDVTYINERNRVFNKKVSLFPLLHPGHS